MFTRRSSGPALGPLEALQAPTDLKVILQLGFAAEWYLGVLERVDNVVHLRRVHHYITTPERMQKTRIQRKHLTLGN